MHASEPRGARLEPGGEGTRPTGAGPPRAPSYIERSGDRQTGFTQIAQFVSRKVRLPGPSAAGGFRRVRVCGGAARVLPGDVVLELHREIANPVGDVQQLAHGGLLFDLLL